MGTELVTTEPDHASPPRLAGVDTAAIVEAWLTGRSPRTVRAYARDLDAFRSWLSHACPAAPTLEAFFGLASGHANATALAYRSALLGAGLASATVARRLAALRSLCKLAYTLGRVAWVILISSPRAERRRDVRGPDQAERKRLFKYLRGSGDTPRAHRDRAIVALLFGLGLRRSEVTALDLEDLNFRDSEIRIRGKGQREKTTLTMPAEVARLVGRWALVRGDDQVVKAGGSAPLFTRTDRPDSTDRLTGEGLARVVERLGKAAGLTKKLRPHAFRHASITKIRSSGITDRDAKSFSRHVRTETLELYDDRAQEAQARVASFVAKELG